MQKLLMSSSLLVGVLALGACAVEARSSDADAESPADLLEPIQTIDVGREQLQFFDAGEGSTIISSTKPNEIPRFTVDVLEETAGTQLTALEVFRAVAPADAEPAAKLVENHYAEVVALGRTDSEPRKVAFELQREVPLEKAFTSQQCHSLLLGNTIVAIARDNQTFLDMCTANRPMIPQGSCSHWIQTSRHRAGFCNNASSGSQFGVAKIESEGASSGSTSASVPPNTAQLWTGTPALNDRLTAFRRSKMRLTTRNNFGTFHARLADF